MYPKAYLFHDDPCNGIADLFSSPMILTFSANQIYQNQKNHQDIHCMLSLYQANGQIIYPRHVTTVYAYDQAELIATILKFGLQHYCYLKSAEHFTVAKSLTKIHKKLEGTMQNISGLEPYLRNCHKGLKALKIEGLSPLELAEIDDLAHVLTFRKVAPNKLRYLIQSEFIDNIC